MFCVVDILESSDYEITAMYAPGPGLVEVSDSNVQQTVRVGAVY